MSTAQKVRPQHCFHCFGKLDPQDPQQALRSFVECRQCHMRYHEMHRPKLGCLNCGNQIFDPITLSRPRRVWPRTKRHAVPVKPSAHATGHPTSSRAPNNRVELLLIVLLILVILGFVLILRPT